MASLSFLRGMAIVVLLSSVSVAGCALHLHNPADAKQAKAALEGYGKVNFDEVMAKAWKNSTELSKLEREAVVRLTDTLVAAEVARLLTEKPASGEAPTGWFRLEREARDILGPLEILEESQLKLRTTQDARRIQNRLFLLEEQRADLITQRERLDVFIRRYVRGTPPGRQVTRCDYQPAPEDLADQIPTPEEIARQPRPPDESEQKWDYYSSRVVEACDVVRSAERRADPAEFLVRDKEFRELDDRVKQLEAKVRADVVEARRLEERLAAATKALADAEAKLAEATAQKQTEKAAARVAELRNEVAKNTETIDAIVKETQKLPLAGVLAKKEILQTILTNFRALGGEDASGAHEVTKHLLTALKTYPDVSGPLRAADKPPVNLLLLELAAQRLEFQRLDAEVRAERDRLKILQARREAWIQRAKNWIEVVKAVETIPNPDPFREQPIAVAHGEGNAEQKSSMTAVVNGYAETRVRYDGTVAGLAFDDDDRRRMLRHDLSNVALTAWKDFIRAPLQEITAYHEGGLTSQDIANVIQALGLGGIAVGVNR